MKKIAVAVVSFNGEKWLDKCISSIQENVLSADLFIWDNNSIDSSRQIISKYKNIKYSYFSKKNIGFGKANNYLVSKIIKDDIYDYCLLLNQDAWLTQNTLENFTNLLSSFQEYTVVCPLHVSANKKTIEESLMHYLRKANLQSIMIAYPDDLKSLNSIYPIYATNAAAWFLKLADIRKLGLFDPLFFYTAEDTDFTSRLKYHNYKIGISPRLQIVHDTDTQIQNTPVNSEKYFHSHTADVYIRAKDIGSPILKGVLRAYGYLAKHTLSSIKNMEYWRFCLNLNLLFKFSFDITKIASHRKKSKQLDGPFLITQE